MKKTILITGLFLMINAAFCQSLVQDNKIWNVINCMNFSGCSTTSYKLSGDTTINQIQYMKLYESSEEVTINWMLCGTMRENENKVFYYNFENESLLYDFGLNIGDHFSSEIYANGELWQVDLDLMDIDTVLLMNGESRRRFVFSGSDPQEYWIEGIGSLCGPIITGINTVFMDIWWDLSCSYFEDEQIYQASEAQDCYINTVGIEDVDEKINYSISPNPFSDLTTLCFDYQLHDKYHAHLVNSMGEIVWLQHDITSGVIEIPRNHLEAGLYIVKLYCNKKAVLSSKLIIQ